jgi:LacI family transcriptional regulator
MRRTTIREIAAQAGVSVATVDRVLHQRPLVREATVARVEAAARSLGYGNGFPTVAKVALRTGFLLQRAASVFYRQFAADVESAASEAGGVTAQIEFCDDVDPSLLAEQIGALGAQVDALAVVAIDHPLVTDAIAALATRDVPVISLLSELSAPACRGHAGINNRAAGRTAGWAVAHCAAAPGPVGVLIGSHGYLGQEDREIGFRSYLRERAPQLSVLEPIVCLDDPRLAESATRELLARTGAPIVALYVAGGGEAGAILALDEATAARPICVCHELSPPTRGALLSGSVAVAIAQDSRDIARRAVRLLAQLADGEPQPGAVRPILEPSPFSVHTSENL